MNAEEALTLHFNRLAFYVALDVTNILTPLESQGIFSQDEVSSIVAAPEGRGRTLEFLRALVQKPDPAYQTFLGLLTTTSPKSQHLVLAEILQTTRAEIADSPTQEAKVKDDVHIHLVPVWKGSKSEDSMVSLQKFTQDIREGLLLITKASIHQKLLFEYGVIIKRVTIPQLELIFQLQVTAKHERLLTDLENTAMAQKIWSYLVQLDYFNHHKDTWTLTTQILPSEAARVRSLAQGDASQEDEGDTEGRGRGTTDNHQEPSGGSASVGHEYRASDLPARHDRAMAPPSILLCDMNAQERVVWKLLATHIMDTKVHYRDFYSAMKKCIHRAPLTKLRSEIGYSLFHLVIQHKRLELMRVFQYCGLFAVFYQLPVGPEGKDTAGLTPTELASRVHAGNERSEMERLLKVEKTVERDLMKQACRAGQLKEFTQLVEKTPGRVIATAEGMCCLDWAIVSGSLPMVQAVIEVEKKIKHRRSGSQQLELIVNLGLHAMLEVVIEHVQSDSQNTEISGKALVEKTAEFGDWETFMAIRHIVDNIPDTIVSIAALHGRHQFIERFLEEYGSRISLTFPDKRKKTPLHFAAERGHAEVVKLLLDREVDIKLKDKRGRTVLHCAAEGGSVPVLEVLVVKAQELNCLEELLNEKDLHLGSELCFLVRGRDQEMSAWHYVHVDRALLDVFRVKTRGGAVDVAKYGSVIRSGWGMNPSDDIVQTVEAKFDAANIPESALHDMLPLHIAILKSNEALALRLIELMTVKGINTQDCFGLTPLHLACMRGSSQVVAALDKKCAHREIQDQKGRLAMTLADKNNHPAVVQLLASGSLFESVEVFVSTSIAPVLDRLSQVELQRRSGTGEDMNTFIKETLRDLTDEINEFLFDKLDAGPIMEESQR